LVGCKSFAVDASLIKADANRQIVVQRAEELIQFDLVAQFVSIWRC
jgi:hypothetical protein